MNLVIDAGIRIHFVPFFFSHHVRMLLFSVITAASKPIEDLF